MLCFGSLGHVGNLSFGLVLSVKDARLNLKTYLMTRKPITQYILTQERTQLQSIGLSTAEKSLILVGIWGSKVSPVIQSSE